MNEQIEPHPPLIPSQLSASLQSENLRKSQDFHTYDGDGLVWHLQVSHFQKPDKHDPSKITWDVRLSLSVKVDVDTLIRTGTMDPVQDERLANMLRPHEPIHFAVRPKLISATDEQSSLRQAKLAIPDYLKQVENKPLAEFKRKSIYRMIDEGCRFK